MTNMKKRYYKRKANEIRKGRKVSFKKACDRLARAFRELRKELGNGAIISET